LGIGVEVVKFIGDLRHERYFQLCFDSFDSLDDLLEWTKNYRTIKNLPEISECAWLAAVV
jgi:hypothetical protein